MQHHSVWDLIGAEGGKSVQATVWVPPPLSDQVPNTAFET